MLEPNVASVGTQLSCAMAPTAKCAITVMHFSLRLDAA